MVRDEGKRGKMKRKRIAVFGQKRIPSREGGVDVVVEELSTRMVESGYEVTCYNRMGHHVGGAEYDSSRNRQYKGIVIKSVPTLNIRGLAAASSSLFATMCSAFGRYDVVHIHTEGIALFCGLPKLMGKKVVCSIHGLDYARSKWSSAASKYIKMGEKAAVKHADEIIVLSHEMQRYFKNTYNRDTTYIPNGVSRPTRYMADEIEKKFGLTKDSFILYLGRIVPEKGEHYLIEAFRQIDTDKKLVIAGGVSDTDGYAKALKELSEGDDRIIFTGFVQGRVLEELYSNAYLYCLPSDLEGMPLSLLEAMSYENCCLTSDIAECAEVIEDKGVTFKKGNVQDLKTKLELLCRDTNLVQKYRNDSSDFVCCKYDWDKTAKQTMELYT